MLRQRYGMFAALLLVFSFFGTALAGPRQLGAGGFGDRGRGAEGFDRFLAEDITTLLYNAALFREPEAAGLRYYVRILTSGGYRALTDVVAPGFGNSPEFQNVVLSRHSAEEVVENLYYYLLNRFPSQGESDFYVRMIFRGRGADAVVAIVRSPEFFSLHLRDRVIH